MKKELIKEIKDFKLFSKDYGVSSTTLDQYQKIQMRNVLNVQSKYEDPTNMTPYILEERQLNVAQMDVFSRLMLDRTIFLGTGIDDQVANIINAQMLFLESIEAKKDIKLIVNSGGGSVHSGLAIYDTMQFIKPDVSTTVLGMAASMAFVLASSGTKGKRFALRHSRLMQHQPMAGIQPGTQASDMDITVKEINKLKKELYTIIAENTSQTYEKIKKDCDRDYWLTAVEAVKYGVIDEVLSKRA